ncbi:hypothetical protein BCR37DRAFT_158727 [Protomyces lactucae-debilis]|uniref:Nucleotide-diphospho-sugar transferase n=1 Tax=Protomyces lactucae-debilis TaxID=2754530 RepID=A0A1Y2F245_PROLT|nr:uncharacterized protein BCR37DRAFT_158727 [Protomyces lactucae-debilis]ORY77035.1 hypothetical protein BCR37DRAFT_158727 [Protomyces lactucae-debilis]
MPVIPRRLHRYLWLVLPISIFMILYFSSFNTQEAKWDTDPYSPSRNTAKAGDKGGGAIVEMLDPQKAPAPYYYKTPDDTHLDDYKDVIAHNLFSEAARNRAFALSFDALNPELDDINFATTLNMIWRLLWAADMGPHLHPVVVYVASYVPERQRDIFRGAGAIVKETGFGGGFSIIDLWNEPDYSTIAYFDHNAFPIKNVNGIFDALQLQRCVLSKMNAAEKALGDDFCLYAFGTVPLGKDYFDMDNQISEHTLVLDPNPLIHKKLVESRGAIQDTLPNARAKHRDLYLVNAFFSASGSHPAQKLGREYGVSAPTYADDESARVIHEKIWQPHAQVLKWLHGRWNNEWMQMIYQFNSEEWAKTRYLDEVTPPAGGKPLPALKPPKKKEDAIELPKKQKPAVMPDALPVSTGKPLAKGETQHEHAKEDLTAHELANDRDPKGMGLDRASLEKVLPKPVALDSDEDHFRTSGGKIPHPHDRDSDVLGLERSDSPEEAKVKAAKAEKEMDEMKPLAPALGDALE